MSEVVRCPVGTGQPWSLLCTFFLLSWSWEELVQRSPFLHAAFLLPYWDAILAAL